MSDYPMLISNKLHSFRNFTGTKLHNPEEKFYACKTHPQDQMLFRPGNPDDRIHHHALDRDRQPNLGRDKSQIGVFGTDYTTPKTGCPTAGVIDTIFFRKVVPTGGNRQNFRHDFQLLPQPFFG